VQIDIGNEARDKYKNPFLPATIIFGMICVCLIGLAIYLFIDNSKKYEMLAQLQATIDMLKMKDDIGDSNIESGVEPNYPTNERTGSYLSLPNVGLEIPLSPEIISKIDVVEVDDVTYRIDVKKITEYRKKGFCGNGGSGAVAMITKNTVKLENTSVGGDTGVLKKKSQWSNNTIVTLNNEVLYPKEYVTFKNLDAVCYDLGEGGKERGEEVAKEVQEINNALETALLKARAID
jgi:hypothetical protein